MYMATSCEYSLGCPNPCLIIVIQEGVRKTQISLSQNWKPYCLNYASPLVEIIYWDSITNCERALEEVRLSLLIYEVAAKCDPFSQS